MVHFPSSYLFCCCFICFYIFDTYQHWATRLSKSLIFKTQHVIIIMQIINKMHKALLQSHRGAQTRAKIKIKFLDISYHIFTSFLTFSVGKWKTKRILHSSAEFQLQTLALFLLPHKFMVHLLLINFCTVLLVALVFCYQISGKTSFLTLQHISPV